MNKKIKMPRGGKRNTKESISPKDGRNANNNRKRTRSSSNVTMTRSNSNNAKKLKLNKEAAVVNKTKPKQVKQTKNVRKGTSVAKRILFDEIDGKGQNKVNKCKAKANVGKTTTNNNAKPSSVNTKGDAFIVGDGFDVEVDEEELDYEDTDAVENEGSNRQSDSPQEADEEDSDVDLGATGESVNQEKLIMENPSLRKLFNQLLDERIKQASEKGESSGSTLLSSMSPQQRGKQNPGNGNKVNLVKSPSDTTVYVPALKQRTHPRNNPPVTAGGLFRGEHEQQDEVANRISNFVESVRLEQQQQMTRNEEREEARNRSTRQSSKRRNLKRL